MAHPHRLVLAVCLFLALALLGAQAYVASAAGAAFAEPAHTGLKAELVVPPHQDALVPGGWYRELFEISAQVDARYALSVDLSTPGHDVDGFSILIQDADGRALYEGSASNASIVGRVLHPGVPEWITVVITLDRDSADLPPGSTVHQSWTVTAQPF